MSMKSIPGGPVFVICLLDPKQDGLQSLTVILALTLHALLRNGFDKWNL